MAAWIRQERWSKLVTGAVDRVPLVSEQQLRRCRGRSWVALEARKQLPEPTGIGLRVIVEERHIRASSTLDSDVHSAGETLVRLQCDNLRFREVALHERHRVILGAVVDHDCFHRGHRLLSESFEATAEQVTSDEWKHLYSRESAAFPVASLRVDKYWPPVGRVDGPGGDRNLVCACPPLEAYA